MKTKFPLLICLFFIQINLFSQSTDWAWVKGSGGLGNDNGHSIATDTAGNVYVTGTFTGTAIWGNDTLIGKGNTDIFLTKYDSLGNIVWVIQGGGKNIDMVSDMSILPNGNCVIVGTFKDSAEFGGITLITHSVGNMFVAEYDANGAIVWAKQANGTGSATAQDVIIDPTGTVYVTGDFTGTITGNGTSLTNSATIGTDVFLWKMNALGNVLWAKSAGGSSINGGRGLSLDKNGNIFVSGVCSGVSHFGTTILLTSGSNDTDIFLAKYDAQGNLLWAKQYGGAFSETPNDMDIDKQGNLYITGNFAGNSQIGSVVLTTLNGDMLLAKTDASGNVLWAKQSYSQSVSGALGLALDSLGSTYATGFFTDTLWLGGNTLIAKGSFDIFIIKYDTWGSPIWVKQAGGASIDIGNEVALDNKGNAYLTGSYLGNAQFDNLALTGIGSNDIWVGKLRANEIVAIRPPSEMQLTVFPNPTHGNVTLQNPHPNEINYEVYSVMGIRLQKGTILANSSTEINLFAGKGVYYLHIQDSQSSQSTISKIILY